MPVDLVKFFDAAQGYIASETGEAERAYGTAMMAYFGEYEAGFLDPALENLERVVEQVQDRLPPEERYWISAVLRTIYLRYGGEMSEQCPFAENVTRSQMYRLSREVVSEMQSKGELNLPHFEQHYDIRETAGTWNIPFILAKEEEKEGDILISREINVLINMHCYETTGPIKDEIRRQLLSVVTKR
jgi:hypothetical protein